MVGLIDEESRCVISHTLLNLSVGTTSNLHGSHHHIGATEDLIHFIHCSRNVGKAHYYRIFSSRAETLLPPEHTKGFKLSGDLLT